MSLLEPDPALIDDDETKVHYEEVCNNSGFCVLKIVPLPTYSPSRTPQAKKKVVVVEEEADAFRRVMDSIQSEDPEPISTPGQTSGSTTPTTPRRGFRPRTPSKTHRRSINL